ncbi:anthranilate synthase component I family protein [Paratractidigestivibacter sp.]|uniref:anthranilate synthase component I family protein n=1 Tax=Paratractidigestivibacter sp. TaxID=2847316 RepID=UPI002ABE936E|nr:anthranilate synthase component I family protein [Paratractidigestivibacter sp.]
MSNEEQVKTGNGVEAASAAASPSLVEVAAIAAADATFRRVPVKRELMADAFTTIEAMRRVRAVSNHCFLLESAEADARWGRYSFLGFSPSVELTCVNGELTVTTDVEGPNPQVVRAQVDHPGHALRELIARHKSPQLPGFPPFAGGLVGYFSYDYLKYAEPTLRREGMGREDFLDADLMVFDRVICFDSYRQKVVLVSSVDVSDPAQGAMAASYSAAVAELDRMQEILTTGEKHDFAPLHLERDLAPVYDQERYEQMVRTAQGHIHEGDIFQVVLSDPITAPATGSLFDVYRTLRCTNPSPYMVFMTSDDVEIAAASPETLAKLENGKLFTYPLAGTRPRGKTPEEDAELERGLLADEKELAEHNMLVDLGRNDIGRVAALGSVEVESYHNVLRFSHVMHIGSTVSGRIAADKDAVDVIDSILPAGTLSGAPKLRACQIISELEGAKRGIYGGAIGYLDFSGNLDTCIGIRLAYKKNGEVCVQSGAGIVADSVPAREFQECTNKARAVVEAVRAAEGGLA